MSLDVQGIAQLRRDMQQTRDSMSSNMFSAVKYEAETIMTRSNEVFAPRDKGGLIADSGVDVVRDGNDVTATLWYGRGEAADYAVATHETPSEHDPPTWKGIPVTFTHGGPQYLSRPVMDAEEGFADRVAKRVMP